MSASRETTPEIAEAVRRLRAGRLVAFPTETVYGLGADALNPESVARVFALKGRPAHNPLIVHVADAEAARPLAERWPPRAQRLAEVFWPGPLTIVVPRSPLVPDLVTGGGATVAIRCPDHPLALALLRAFGGPLVGPSANPSGSVSPTTAAHVRAAFGEADVVVIDGGACRVGIESTVVSVAGERPIVLRRGAIGPEAIGDALGESVACAPSAAHESSGALSSPGMLPSHYAPDASVLLFHPSAPPRELERSPRPIVVLSLSASFQLPRESRGPRTLVRMPTDADAYGAKLYAALREADEARAEIILVEEPREQGPMWDAIRDRLSRAAAPRANA